MFVNKEKVKALMVEKTKTPKHPNGNYNEFARKIGVNVAQLHRTLNHIDSVAGPIFLGRFLKYCQKEGLNFNDYIFLDKPLHVGNDEHSTTSELPPTGTD